MFQNNTKIIAFIGIILLLVSVGAFAFLVYTVSAQKVAYQEKVVERELAKTHQASLKELLETLEETKEDRDTLVSRIVEEEGVIDFLSLIETVGKEQGVVLKTNSLTVEPINAVFEKLVINLSVTGSYASVVQVLKLLEHVPYQATIKKTTIGREGGKEAELLNEWKGTFELSVTKFKKV